MNIIKRKEGRHFRRSLNRNFVGLMKRCYYMCVRLCGVYVRGVLYPVERCFNI